MDNFENMDEAELRQFQEFKRNLNLQAAQAQIGKIEYELNEPSVDKTVLRRACQEANSLKIGAICALPCYVKSCVNFLGANPDTSVIACISFPHGGDTTEAKVAAVKNAVKNGADEVEVTASVAYIKDGNWGLMKRELKKLRNATKKCGLRLNLESTLLSLPELVKTCTFAAECGIRSIRISSGDYCKSDPDTVTRVKAAVKDRCTVKAVGVTTVADMNNAVNLGADIIGSKNAADLAHLILRAV